MECAIPYEFCIANESFPCRKPSKIRLVQPHFAVAEGSFNMQRSKTGPLHSRFELTMSQVAFLDSTNLTQNVKIKNGKTEGPG
jgi:hypothetical protein